jgi:hypothetical protein
MILPYILVFGAAILTTGLRRRYCNIAAGAISFSEVFSSIVLSLFCTLLSTIILEAITAIAIVAALN